MTSCTAAERWRWSRQRRDSAARSSPSVSRLLADPVLRRRLAERGRALAAAYSWPRVAAAHRDLYARTARVGPMPDRYADILVVDLLGGIGDLLMLLPAMHGLARRQPGRPAAGPHPRARAPTWCAPTRRWPRCARPGTAGPARSGRRSSAALAARRPDLAVSTTRYDGIPDLLRGRRHPRASPTCGGDPPPDAAGRRTATWRLLHAEGLLDPAGPDRPTPGAPARDQRAPAGESGRSARLVAASPAVDRPARGAGHRRRDGGQTLAVTAPGATLAGAPDAAAGHPVLTVGPVDPEAPLGVPLPPRRPAHPRRAVRRRGPPGRRGGRPRHRAGAARRRGRRDDRGALRAHRRPALRGRRPRPPGTARSARTAGPPRSPTALLVAGALPARRRRSGLHGRPGRDTGHATAVRAATRRPCPAVAGAD